MFQKIDDWLFDNKRFGFQVIANKWQRLTGLNCFWLARVTTIMWVIALMCGALLDEKVSAGEHLLWLTLAPISLASYFLTMYFWIERRCGTQLNPLRLEGIGWRFIGIVLLGLRFFSGVWLFRFDPLFILHTIQDASFVASCYLESCIPLPPQKSEARKWLEKLLAGSVRPEPVTVPVQTR